MINMPFATMDVQYIRLSSGDPSVLPTSKSGDFTVQLGTTVNCEGNCDMYLLEAAIPFTWYNVMASDGLTITVKKKTTRVTITPAYYISIPVLVAALNEQLKTLGFAIKLSAHPTTLRVSINCGDASITGSLLTILGWGKGATVTGKDQEAPRMGDISRGVRSVFVYLDCIQPTNAGSFQVQLLKEIPIGKHVPGDIISYRQKQPVVAHKLNTNTLSQIYVNVKDAHNRTIDFNGFDIGLLCAIKHR